jgi:hypothetical protein
MIVWLDAPDTDLLKRIRNRDKEHVVKNKLVETAFEFLTGCRHVQHAYGFVSLGSS